LSTKCHADDFTVKLTGGRALRARRVGADPETDLPVIQVRADGLTELPFGDSDRLDAGAFVFAVGQPDFIQTDAAIYPGNSDGTLVNLRAAGGAGAVAAALPAYHLRPHFWP
jgi:S1-C subfamily serine protease